MKLLHDLFFCLLLVTIVIYSSSLRLCELCEINKTLKIEKGSLPATPRNYTGSTYNCLNTTL